MRKTNLPRDVVFRLERNEDGHLVWFLNTNLAPIQMSEGQVKDFFACLEVAVFHANH